MRDKVDEKADRSVKLTESTYKQLLIEKSNYNLRSEKLVSFSDTILNLIVEKREYDATK